MEINQSITAIQGTQKIDENNQKTLFFEQINLLMTAIIFISVLIFCYSVMPDSALGYIIMIQGVIFCFFQSIQIILKKQLEEKDSNKIQQVKRLNKQYILKLIHTYIISNQYFDFLFQLLVTTVYFTFFEVLLVNLNRITHIIIISQFLSLFSHSQQKSIEKQYVYLIYTLMQQVYTILRLQLTIKYEIYDLIFNIVFLLYSLSYNNTFITKTQKQEMNIQNQQNLTQQVTRLYQNILSIIPEGLAVINSDKKLLYANPTLKKILQSNQRTEIQQILMNLGKNNTKIESIQKSDETQQKPSQVQSNKQQNIPNIQTSFNNNSQDNRKFKKNHQRNSLSPRKLQRPRISSPNKNQQPSSTFAIVEALNCPQQMHSKSARDIMSNNKLSGECSIANQDFMITSNQRKSDILSSVNIIHQNNRKSIISIKNGLQSEKPKFDFHLQNNESYEDTSKYSIDTSQNVKNQTSNQTIPMNQSRTIFKNNNNFQQSSNKIEYSQKLIKANIKDFSNNHIPQSNHVTQSNYITQSNPQYGSEQSEILSFQGFGFFMGEEESIYPSVVPGQAQKQIKRSSESYSIRASVDQNSVMTLSQNSQYKYQSQLKNGINVPNLFSNIQMRLNQKKQNDYPQTIEELKESKYFSQDEIESKNQQSSRNQNKSDFFFKEKITNNSPPQTENQTLDPISLNIKKLSSTDQTITFRDKNRSKQQISINKLFNQNPESGSFQNYSNTNNLILQKDQSKSKEQVSLSNQGSQQVFTLKVKNRGNASSINKSDENIQLKKTDVSNILDHMFSNNPQYIGETGDQIKEEVIHENDKEDDSITSKDKNDHILDGSTNGSKRRNSFISHLKKDQEQQNMTYLQQKDNLTKIQVKYKNKDLVVQFLLVDMFQQDNQNQNKNPLVLIMVQDMWQELYLQKVQDIQKDKMKIFASLSHELRTPLNCSISMLEVLRDEIYDTNPDYVNEYLNPALFSNKLLLNQINDILDFVQMDCGRFKYSYLEFSINDLMRDCIKLVSMQAQMKGLQLLTSCDPLVPQIISSDPNRIRQILLNFLSNSLKFTKQGFIQIGVECIRNGLYKLYVKDTGIGITEKNLNDLFDFCGKVNYNKQDEGLNAQGCGLGLTISNSIAKGLVQNIDIEGGIRVESKYGEGSIFSILLQDRNEKYNMPDQLIENQPKIQNQNNIQQLKKLTSSAENDEIQKHFFKNQVDQQNSVSYHNNSHKLMIQQYCDQCNNKEEDNSSNETCYFCEEQKAKVFKMNQNLYISAIHDLMDDSKNYSQIGSPLSPQKMNDSAMVEDDEEETNNNHQICFHSDIKLKHHYWLSQDQQNYDLKKILKQKQSSPIHQGKDIQKGFEKINRENYQMQNTDEMQNLSSLKQIENSQKTFGFEESQKNQQSGTSIDKKQKYNSSQKNLFQNMKSIMSFKTHQLEYERQTPDQEGFTSYITLNKKQLDNYFNQSSSNLHPNSATIFEKKTFNKTKTNMQQSITSIKIGQNNQVQDQILMDDKKVLQSIVESQIHQPTDIISDIINNNLVHKKNCNCPQIMIVDDNQFNLYALGKIVKQFQFEFQTISESLDVLDEIKNIFESGCCLKPKIIFMDIEMPEKNGYQIAIEIHQYYKKVNLRELPIIIACTAYVGQEDRDKAIQSGMDDFINKPILKNAFIQLLINWKHLFI